MIDSGTQSTPSSNCKFLITQSSVYRDCKFVRQILNIVIQFFGGFDSAIHTLRYESISLEFKIVLKRLTTFFNSLFRHHISKENLMKKLVEY